MEKRRNEKLQALCRDYLGRLRYMANKHGLKSWIDDTIKANANKECSATEKEVTMLSRICDDERIHRIDIPAILGKSYRDCFDNDDFSKIKKLRRVGTYSKVSALLYACNPKNFVKKT